MVRAIKRSVQIQPGGRVELVAPELPAGTPAEVIVLISEEQDLPARLAGAFADQAELLDEIVAEAMADRKKPLR